MRSALVVCLILLTALPASAEELIRISVGRFKRGLTVTGAGLVALTDEGTRIEPEGPLTFKPRARGIVVGGRTYPAEVIRIEAPGMIGLSGHNYRRRLEVRWRSFRGRPELLVVHPVPIETYVAGIVSSELPKKWPYEALRAQAVAARTYAIWQKYRNLDVPYHMESSVLDQVYHGAEREHPNAIKAVTSTHGVILTYKRRPAHTFFHSTCGGHTESAKDGWGSAKAYLPGSSCGFCKRAGRYKWTAKIKKDDLDKAFVRHLGEPIVSLKIVKRSKTGRALKVQLRGASKTRTVTGADFRRLLGYTRVWSTKITKLELAGSALVVEGRGAGHGVGMCQWGARGMAEAGKKAESILTHYYPGADLVRLY